VFRTQDEPAGSPFRVGAAGPADAARIGDFIAGLTMRTQFRRFFATVARPSSSLLRSLTGADGRADVLVATDAAGAIVGHGMAVDRTGADGGRVTDLGLVVADQWQRQGIGSALLGQLAQRAAGRGSRELVLDVLPTNEPMLGMISRRWPDARREFGPDTVVIRACLDRASQPAGAARAA
jgi:GNAT superfamily N-acetyltransferase